MYEMSHRVAIIIQLNISVFKFRLKLVKSIYIHYISNEKVSAFPHTVHYSQKVTNHFLF